MILTWSGVMRQIVQSERILFFKGYSDVVDPISKAFLFVMTLIRVMRPMSMVQDKSLVKRLIRE